MITTKYKFCNDLSLNLVTPYSIVVWSDLNKPNTRFEPEGIYTVQVSCSQEDSAELVKSLDNMMSLAAKEYKTNNRKKDILISDTLPWRRELTPDNKPTGNYLFRAKMFASQKIGDKVVEKKPIILDYQLTPCNVLVGRGSIIKVSMRAYPYYDQEIGLSASLKLIAVQVIKVKSSNY